MTTISVETYYQILGISSNATISEIKLAFRQKAKELHPDMNKSPDASEKFILLTEAYEYLINLKTGKSKAPYQTTSHTDWQKESRDQAQQRAKKYANMKFEEYKKTDHYKNSQAALTVFQHVYFFSSILIIMSPLWGYLFKEWVGFFVGLFFTFLSVHY
jgi:DnaJ-class molecular chaperone